MQQLITRLRKGTRRALVPSLVTILALPIGATVGLGLAGSPAQAAVPEAASAQGAAATTDPTPSRQGTAPSAVDESVPLSEAVPWTADPALAKRADEAFDVLVFHKTAAFRHSNIDEGITAIQQLGAQNNFTVTVSGFDPANASADQTAQYFTDAGLEPFEAVIFLSTTGDVLNASQQAAFERYIQAGGGYAGIHAASDTEYDWPWYGNLVGAYFNNHPNGTPTATVKVEDPAHPSTKGIERRWQRTDEWYNFRTNPRTVANGPKVHVLASLDETTYTPGTGSMGAEHPIAWCQDYDGGRSWYTGMGHTEASFQSEPKFLNHILGGIKTAAGVIPSDCKATLQPSFEKVALDENTTNPMELTIAEDGRVIYIDRAGAVRIIQTNGSVSTAGTVPVYTGQEFGLLGIALDPNFATNGWFYLYYAPAGTASIDRISRFTMTGNTFDPAAGVTILDVPVQRNECCHAGGAMEFDKDGNLYLATGDNTNPFASDGYAPIDERSGRTAWDAQRTSANTNDLNGKVLKIKPLAAGGYSIPAGNLFDEAADTQQKTRPEIYAMGFRNPFRIGLDEQNNKLLVADYGPDAGSTSATRGPNGRVEWNVLDQPGFYGWPYCVGNNTPYNDYNFANSTAGAAFNCAAPVNDSPNNTGLTNLPPAKAAVIWQSNNAATTGTPEIGASGAPMTSGTYSYDPDLVSDRKWPAYFDSKAIWADWNNNRLFTVQMNETGTGYTDINRFLANLPMRRPHALQFGPDGALYMIEWGSGFDGNNADSGIYRIDYTEGDRAPVARVTTNRTSGPAPLTVNFDGSGSFDGDTGSSAGLTYAWDFTSDGTVDATTPTASFTYTTAGNYTARLTVSDGTRTGTTNIDIVAGNTAPTVELELPLNGGFFEFGDVVRYKVTVTDPEDGTIDCSKVTVQPGLGHDQHSHGYELYQGCEGSFPLPGDAGHVGANIFGTVTASYTDKGNGAAGALTSVDGAVLHTKKKEAEFYDITGRTGTETTGTPGVGTTTTTDTNGGLNVNGVETGDWFGWNVMNLTNITGVKMRVSSTVAGATFAVRQGSPTGTTVGTITVPNTGGAQTWQDVSTTFTGASAASGPLYVVATSGGGNVNWLEFAGRGITDNTPPSVTITASTTNGAAPLPVSFTSTVTDPDDPAPYTYAWSFGDSTTSTAANPTKTYTTPGRYTVSLTVTDARGAKTTRTTEVVVTVANNICFSGRSDDFVGTELNTTRWNQNVRVNQSMTVANGSLNIPLTNSDLYQTTNTTPNVVLQNLPSGAFTATTKVDLTGINKGYQQGGLVVYGDDNNYLKLVYSGRSTAAAGSKAANIIQFAKEVNGTATETNSANLGAAFPDTVWLRMTSTDGNVVTPSYSTDGATWLPITLTNGTTAPTRDLTGITSPKVGLLALGATAAGAADNLVAKFDYFTITPDDTATPCDDGCLQGFSGTTVPNNWQVVRPTGNITVAGGSLNIPLAATDLYQTTNNQGDLVLRSLPTGAFEATTKVDLTGINKGYQQGGLLIYGDDNNYIKLVYSGRSTAAAGDKAANIIQLTKETNATAAESNSANLGAAFPDVVWLRLATTDGTNISASYSTDGATYTPLALANGNPAPTRDLTGMTNPRIGLIALASTAAGAADNRVAKFDSFELKAANCDPAPTADTTAPATTHTIPAANGTSGWYTTRPSFTLAATDAGSGVLSTEYRIAGGAWTPYTAAVPVTGEGDRLVEYRSTDRSGNVEAIKSFTVKVDTVVPTVAGTVTGDSTKSLAIAGTDATSGIARVEYQIGSATTWTTYTAPVVFATPGSYVVSYRSIDGAGNTSAVGSSTVVVPEAVDTTAPKVDATVLGSYAGTVLDQAASGVSGSATLVSAASGNGYTTTVKLNLSGLQQGTSYESHLHVGMECGGFEGHYRDDPAGAGVPPNELWPTNPGWTAASGDPRIKADAQGKSYAEATVAWAPRVEGGILAIHREGAIIGCVDLELTGPGTVVLKASDARGVTSFTYSLDGEDAVAYTAPFQITEPGAHVVSWTARDAAGNETVGETEVVVPEGPATQAPTVTMTSVPAAPNGANGWYKTSPRVTLTGSGGSGALRFEYRMDDGPWEPYIGPGNAPEGITRFRVRAVDATGTASEVLSQVFKVDTEAPSLTVTGIVNGAQLDVAATRNTQVTSSDETSGIDERVIRIDGEQVGSRAVIDALTLLTGNHRMVVTVIDNAGNVSKQTIAFKVVATYPGGERLVQRLDAENKVAASRATKLLTELRAAERADQRGNFRAAFDALERFRKQGALVANRVARTALVDLARQLKNQL